MTHVLTLNAGSSSLKSGLFLTGDEPNLVAEGHVDRIGSGARLRLSGPDGETLVERVLGAGDHESALKAALAGFDAHFPDSEITAVGHRVVHGGMDFAEPVELSDAILARLEAFVPFAPLHQPHNLAGIAAARNAFPDARQIACFDTAFHRNHPFVNDVFALPRAYYDKGIRRYGFHGLSYDYISSALARTNPALHAGRVIVAHLGNGASMCAMRAGKSVASSMGFSALDGLPMGTRSGQLDPGVLLYLLESEGLSAQEISDLLYRKSGLLGLSGLSSDMRTLLASDSERAREAIDYFCFRIRRELGGLAAALEGLDALVFTGGIGENAAPIRAQVCRGLGWLGIELDEDRNDSGETVISANRSSTRVLVIPTDEERVIARATAALVA
ncbi:acetate/propionate family kinase [Maritimibacter dapengensis]|uniref:Acetate kinase n=1 Tax=Maritimibacter dapengensis TaxID=2836868 RepID=A0ABS6SYH7_9RHOB|nr:acetate/propionate family kinase [Maritimibacter dapengensis]